MTLRPTIQLSIFSTSDSSSCSVITRIMSSSLFDPIVPELVVEGTHLLLVRELLT